MLERPLKEGQHLAPAMFGGGLIVDREVRLHPAMRRGVGLGTIADVRVVQSVLETLRHGDRVATVVFGGGNVQLGFQIGRAGMRAVGRVGR